MAGLCQEGGEVYLIVGRGYKRQGPRQLAIFTVNDQAGANMTSSAVRAATYTPLIDQIWPVSTRPALRAATLLILGSMLLMASAKAQVPMWPVPMTMQTFVVLVIGMTYGLHLGTATIVLYLVEGAFGFPVFAGTPEKGIGLAYMMGPTGGYLVGFIIAAALMGWLAERGWDRTLPWAVAAMTAGTVISIGAGRCLARHADRLGQGDCRRSHSVRRWCYRQDRAGRGGAAARVADGGAQEGLETREERDAIPA